MNPIVLKIGGHESSEVSFLTGLARVVKTLNQPVAIVHGGGKEISTMQQSLGIEPQYLNGVRITDEVSLGIVTMVLCGVVNKRLVRYLLAGGVDALGLSGVDRGIIRAKKMPHPTVDMQFTGEVTSVNGEILRGMIASGVVPVIAPICLGEDSEYNVNADHVAGAVAEAIHASRLVFITNVGGVMADKQVLPSLTESDANRLIAEGIISGGMIPKVQMALEALGAGVPQTVITNLEGLATHGGTVFTKA